jgi:hypothetical protein
LNSPDKWDLQLRRLIADSRVCSLPLEPMILRRKAVVQQPSLGASEPERGVDY